MTKTRPHRLLASILISFLASCGGGEAPQGIGTTVEPQTVASGLERPWGLAFMADGSALVTERPGRMRLVRADGSVGAPIAGVPAVDNRPEGGLLDVVLDSAFETNRTLYFCYARPVSADSSGAALASARLSADAATLADVRVLFIQPASAQIQGHHGCRIVEQGKTLFLTVGDRDQRSLVQSLASHFGKVLRINKDGTVPVDNPFIATPGALPEIWSLGHRNPQGAALHPVTQELWTGEHGPVGGDEINITRAGRNYGWPVISYGTEADGSQVGEGSTKAGMEQPLTYWASSIAPSGMTFLRSDRYGASWRGNLFAGALVGKQLARLKVTGDTATRADSLLATFNERIRNVQEGPDGLLYVLTDADDGKLVRLLPRYVN